MSSFLQNQIHYKLLVEKVVIPGVRRLFGRRIGRAGGRGGLVHYALYESSGIL
jgi:hypothetical protein